MPMLTSSNVDQFSLFFFSLKKNQKWTAAELASSRKAAKYRNPAVSTLRVLAVRFAVETHRPLCDEAVQLLCDLGGRLFVSPATTASVFFNQRISCSVCVSVAARWFLSVNDQLERGPLHSSFHQFFNPSGMYLQRVNNNNNNNNNKLVRLRSPYNMRPWDVNKTKDTARPQGWRKHVTNVLM